MGLLAACAHSRPANAPSGKRLVDMLTSASCDGDQSCERAYPGRSQLIGVVQTSPDVELVSRNADQLLAVYSYGQDLEHVADRATIVAISGASVARVECNIYYGCGRASAFEMGSEIETVARDAVQFLSSGAKGTEPNYYSAHGSATLFQVCTLNESAALCGARAFGRVVEELGPMMLVLNGEFQKDIGVSLR